MLPLSLSLSLSLSVRRAGSGYNAEVSGPSFEPIGDRVGAPSVREPRGCAFVRGQRGLCGEGCMMREGPGSCAAGGACDCVPCDFPAVLAIGTKTILIFVL